jgi:DNA adenine methylase
MGSKRRIAKYILPFLKENLNGDNYFVDAFCGGCNLVDKLDYPLRIANDINKYLIALFNHLQTGGQLPSNLIKDKYYQIKNDKDRYDDWYVGYSAFLCSSMGKFFESYVSDNWETKTKVRNYQTEQKNNILKQMPALHNVCFTNNSYSDMRIPAGAVIYCDPPYKGTRGYRSIFDHDKFYQWCREMKANGHTIFISEYQMPEDFKCVWQMDIKDTLSAKNTIVKTEKLFTL